MNFLITWLICWSASAGNPIDNMWFSISVTKSGKVDMKSLRIDESITTQVRVLMSKWVKTTDSCNMET